MRVTLVISSLSPGGAERVLATMANYWAEKGWSVTLLTGDDGTIPSHYPLHPAVTLKAIQFYSPAQQTPRKPGEQPRRKSWTRSLPHVWLRRLLIEGLGHSARRVLWLRRAIRKSRPDAVISFIDQCNVFTLLATVGLSVPVIAAERNDPHHWSIGSWPWHLARNVLYHRAACVVAQTNNAMHYFSPRVRRRGAIIPNPCPPPRVQESGSGRASEGHTVLAMGRLVEQKGFDLLICGFAKVAPEFPDWRLVIWGQGEDRDKLTALAQELGLGEERVTLPGVTKDSHGELRKGDLFVLSSRHEGFPNVLLEAMSVGLPVVSFDCPSGPAEIIRPGVDGVLVPPQDVDALAAQMRTLMRDEALRCRLGAAATSVVERFALDRVMEMWEQCISRHVSRASR